jgi:hypothetical protein
MSRQVLVGWCPESATVSFDDRARSGQSYAGAVRLCRNERLEDLIGTLSRKADTGVADGNQQLGVRAGFSL